ncbi:MAG: hypothetical protein KC561_12555 [Myxococcales bacterium]|nr:hypothetical protein [Myxococcales bacterium]
MRLVIDPLEVSAPLDELMSLFTGEEAQARWQGGVYKVVPVQSNLLGPCRVQKWSRVLLDSVYSRPGGHVLSVATGRIDDSDAMARLIEAGRRAAQAAPTTETHLPLPWEDDYQAPTSAGVFNDAATAECGPALMINEIAKLALPARRREWNVTGALEVSIGSHPAARDGLAALRNSNGMFRIFLNTLVRFSGSVATSETSASFDVSGSSFGRLDVDSLWEKLRERLLLPVQSLSGTSSSNLILMPRAVSQLLELLRTDFCGELALIDRRRLGARLGEEALGSNITIVADPNNPALVQRPFDSIGAPAQRITLIDAGVPMTVTHTRQRARERREESYGYADGGLVRAEVPRGLVMQGGEATFEGAMESAGSGVVVESFEDIREVTRTQENFLVSAVCASDAYRFSGGRLSAGLTPMTLRFDLLSLMRSVTLLGSPTAIGGHVAPLILAGPLDVNAQ